MIYLLRLYWIPAFAGMMLPQALLALSDRLEGGNRRSVMYLIIKQI
ncbi:hypothetical protein K9N50_07180 [bacterium]|nr:hypothetical protein [bacterium]